MPEIQIQLPRYGEHFILVSRARINGNVVTGQLDFPAYPELDFAHHLLEKPIFPGVQKISLMYQIVQAFCAEATGGKLFPVLRGMPLVRFSSLTKPGEITVRANVFQDGIGGVASCNVSAGNKERASAIFTFDMSPIKPPEIILPLPMDQINIDLGKASQGTISGTYNYTGEEHLTLDKLGFIPFPLILEALCQNTIQLGFNNPSLAKAVFAVTYLRNTVFRGYAPLGTLDLHSDVKHDERRGLVRAAASYDGMPIVDGDFGFVIINPNRAP